MENVTRTSLVTAWDNTKDKPINLIIMEDNEVSKGFEYIEHDGGLTFSIEYIKPHRWEAIKDGYPKGFLDDITIPKYKGNIVILTENWLVIYGRVPIQQLVVECSKVFGKDNKVISHGSLFRHRVGNLERVGA